MSDALKIILFVTLLINLDQGALASDSINNIFSPKYIVNKIHAKKLSNQNCAEVLDDLIHVYDQKYSSLDTNLLKNKGNEIIDDSFNARLAIHSLLNQFPYLCKIKTRILFAKMRIFEDYVALYYFHYPQLDLNVHVTHKGPVPILNTKELSRPHMVIQIADSPDMVFKSGDILLMKGIDFVSSTISETTMPRSLFSHVALVYVDEENKSVKTIESYMDKGTQIYPIEWSLKSGNFRILHLRPKNAEIGKKAAEYMFNRVKTAERNKKYISYDYNSNYDDDSKLSCSEVLISAYSKVSNGLFKIPEVKSEIGITDGDLMKQFGVVPGQVMAPADLEIDSRFSIVTDWTDYRLIRSSWKKDAVMSEIIRWIDKLGYKIHRGRYTYFAQLAWLGRYFPLIDEWLAAKADVGLDLLKNAPLDTISTLVSLREVANNIYFLISIADDRYYKENSRWMVPEHLKVIIDKYRSKKYEKIRELLRHKSDNL